MAEKISLATHLHLPDAIPVLVFTLGVLLLLASWLGSADLGIFKLPELTVPTRRVARWLGLGLLILTLFLYFPFERPSIPTAVPVAPLEIVQESTPPADTTSAEADLELEKSPEFERVIRRFCESSWPVDFHMRAYCVREQKKAVARLERGRPAEIPEDAFNVMRRKCTGEWPDNFHMRAYCEKQQVEGFLETYRGAN